MSKVVIASLLSVGSIFNGCDAFRRFEQLSFSCTSPITGPFELRVIDRSLGDLINLSRPAGDLQLPITNVAEDMLVVSTPQMDWIIDLKSKRVFLSRGKRTVLADCTVKSFSM